MADAHPVPAAPTLVKRRIVEVANRREGEGARTTITLDCGHRRTMSLVSWKTRYPGGMDSLVDCRRPHPDEFLTVGEHLRRAGKMR